MPFYLSQLFSFFFIPNPNVYNLDTTEFTSIKQRILYLLSILDHSSFIFQVDKSFIDQMKNDWKNQFSFVPFKVILVEEKQRQKNEPRIGTLLVQIQ